MKEKHFKLLSEERKKYLLKKKVKDINGLYPGCYAWVNVTDIGKSHFNTLMPAIINSSNKSSYQISFVKEITFGEKKGTIHIASSAWYDISELTKISKQSAKELLRNPIKNNMIL